MKDGDAQVNDDGGEHVSVPADRAWSAVIRAVLGLMVMAVSYLVALYGSIRLGIGRHGEPWWRPFENSLTRPHVENLATFGVGIIGIGVGAWLVVAAVWRRAHR